MDTDKSGIMGRPEKEVVSTLESSGPKEGLEQPSDTFGLADSRIGYKKEQALKEENWFGEMPEDSKIEHDTEGFEQVSDDTLPGGKGKISLEREQEGYEQTSTTEPLRQET